MKSLQAYRVGDRPDLLKQSHVHHPWKLSHRLFAAHFKLYITDVLYCQYARVCECLCVCVCGGGVRARALRIVFGQEFALYKYFNYCY